MKRIVLAVFSAMALGSGSASAADFPIHMFYCGLLDEQPAQQIYLEMSDSDLENGVGELTLSRMAVADNQVRWEPYVAKAKAKVELYWGKANGRPAITAADIDLGRSGRIFMGVTQTMDQYASAPGVVYSGIASLRAPDGKKATYCTYFRSTGPKPGVTGSN